MAELVTKDILKNAVLQDVTSTVWYISPDISKEHAVYIFKTKGYLKMSVYFYKITQYHPRGVFIIDHHHMML
jgi:hypothetical protein